MRFLDFRNWPFALRLTVIFTGTALLTTFVISTLTIQREQKTFRAELEQQAALLLDVLTAATVNDLYFSDVNSLNDVMGFLGREQFVLTLGRFYDADGRIVGDAYDDAIIFQFEVSEFALRVLASEGTVFEWNEDELIAGRAIRVGRQTLGAVAVGLSTAPLKAKIAEARRQGWIVGAAAGVLGVIFGVIFARSATAPLHRLMETTRRISAGDLSQPVEVRGRDEFARLSGAMEHMRGELQELYTNLEGEVKARTLELEIARDKALEANRVKSDLLANVSHELRTPLGAILGFSEMLREGVFGDVSADQREKLGEMIDSTHYLTSLVNGLLDQAKLEAKRVEPIYAEASPAGILRAVTGQIAGMAHIKGLDFAVQIDQNIPPSVETDAEILKPVIFNLLNNAIKFTERGSVTITAGSRGSRHWQFSVRDTGIGIPPEAQTLIFEPFRQVDASMTRRYGGTGLGLSLVKNNINLLGGEITLESALNQGSIFTVILPNRRIAPSYE
jgi:signal transduction histidine kinase